VSASRFAQTQGLNAAMLGLGGGRRDRLDYPELQQ
jgi:hypothetical protein